MTPIVGLQALHVKFRISPAEYNSMPLKRLFAINQKVLIEVFTNAMLSNCLGCFKYLFCQDSKCSKDCYNLLNCAQSCKPFNLKKNIHMGIYNLYINSIVDLVKSYDGPGHNAVTYLHLQKTPIIIKFVQVLKAETEGISLFLFMKYLLQTELLLFIMANSKSKITFNFSTMQALSMQEIFSLCTIPTGI